MQLRSLQFQQREAVRMMKRLSAAAGDSWREIQRSANAIFTDARRTSMTIAKRLRSALTA